MTFYEFKINLFSKNEIWLLLAIMCCNKILNNWNSFYYCFSVSLFLFVLLILYDYNMFYTNLVYNSRYSIYILYLFINIRY